MSNRIPKRLAGTLLLVIAAQAARTQPSVDSITAVELGTLGGTESVAMDINGVGDVVGWADDVYGNQRAFLYQAGGMQPVSATNMTGEAHGINNSGEVVGFQVNAITGFSHAFYWHNGALTVLDDKNYEDPSCLHGSRAHAINDSGQIAGDRLVNCLDNSPPQHANPVRWTNYQAKSERLLPDLTYTQTPSTFAHNINRAGVIVGDDPMVLYTYSGAWFWTEGDTAKGDGAVWPGVPMPLNISPYWYYPGTEHARGINGSGTVVGDVVLQPDGRGTGEQVHRAFYWSPPNAAATGLIAFSDGKNAGASEIDDQGYMVGWGDRWIGLIGYEKRAALWHHDLGIVMLPLPPGYGGGSTRQPTQCEAYAVNDLYVYPINIGNASLARVEAVGYCERGSGKKMAVLWDIQIRR